MLLKPVSFYTSRRIIDGAELVRVERGGEHSREVSRPARERAALVEELTRPRLCRAVRRCKLLERVRPADALAQLIVDEAEELELLVVAASIVTRRIVQA